MPLAGANAANAPMNAALVNAALFGGLALVIGAVSMRVLVLPRCGLSTSERAPAARDAAEAGMWGAAFVFLAAPARAVFYVSSLVEPGDPWMPVLRQVLTATSLGRALQLQAIWSITALLAFAMAHRGRDRGWRAAAIAAGFLAVVPGLVGHAAAAPHPTTAVFAATSHVLGAGIWIGGLFHLWRGAARASDLTLSRLLQAFHAVALSGVTLLVASGAYHTWTLLGTPANLLHTAWGRLLAAKLLLLLAVLAFGYRHWRTAEQALADGSRETLRRSLTYELLLAAAVIAVTSLLAATAAPE